MPDIEKINGYATTSITKLNGIALSSIADVNGYDVPAASLFDVTFNFDGQTNYTTTSTSAFAGWVTGTGSMSSWRGGANACSDTGNKWANGATGTDALLGTNKVSRGFGIDYNATSSSFTGPSGAHNGSGGHSTVTSTDYMYAETSGQTPTNSNFLARTQGYNFSTEMSDTSNDLNLKFYVHAFGQAMGRLHIYYDNAATSKATDATLLATCVGSHSGAYTTGTTTLTNTASSPSTISPASQTWSGLTSNWIQFTVSLNALRSLNDTYYIYFVYAGGTGANGNFRGDLAIDDVQFVEEE